VADSKTILIQGIADEVQTARFDGHGECFIEIGGGKAGFGGEISTRNPSRRDVASTKLAVAPGKGLGREIMALQQAVNPRRRRDDEAD
jgi:hypothetical protein